MPTPLIFFERKKKNKTVNNNTETCKTYCTMSEGDLSIGQRLYFAHAESLSLFYKNNLNENYKKYVNTIVDTIISKDQLQESNGTIYFISCGKTLTVCNKISAMLNSLDISSRSLNANECLHGDIGTIDVNNERNIVFGVTISGNTCEVIKCLDLLSKKKKRANHSKLAMIVGTKVCEMYENSTKWNVHPSQQIVLNYDGIIKDNEFYKGIKAPTLSLQLLYLYMDCLFLDVIDLVNKDDIDNMAERFLVNHPSGGLAKKH